MPTKKEPDFKTAMERLEEIVRLLEDGSKPLEESIALYEEGVALSRICEEKLNAAKLKIETLEKEDLA